MSLGDRSGGNLVKNGVTDLETDLLIVELE
jgi:hypothetical protein